MADKAILTVAFCCVGAVIGYMFGSRLKKRSQYFADIDDFLRGFIGSLDCSMDTVPEVMAAHSSGSELLKNQLEDLCKKKEITSQLVRYLGYRLKGNELWKDYQEAFKRYLSSNEEEVHILGILIRDVVPSEDDLKARAKSLERFTVGSRTIELVGIYVPENEIPDFPKMIQEEYERRSASNDTE